MTGSTAAPSGDTTLARAHRSPLAVGVAATLAMAALLAGAWLGVSSDGFGAAGPLQAYPAYIPIYCYLLLLVPPMRGAGLGRRIVAALIVFVAVVFLTADLTTLRFFGTPFLNVYSYLPVSAGDTSPRVVATTLSSYVSGTVWLIAAGAVGGAMLIANLLPRRDKARLAALVLAPLAYVSAAASSQAAATGDPVIARLIATPELSARTLTHGPEAEFGLAGPTADAPRTIVLVIMESAGSGLPSSDGSMTLSEKVIRDSGVAGWVDFPMAVTNSNASDISIPTMMTGSGAHESARKYAAMPFVSQMAAARGYRTELITGSTMQFAGLDTILEQGRFDRIVTGDRMNLPFVNDLAVDDYYAWRDAVRSIGQADGRLFLVLYFKALHAPFQANSEYRVPKAIAGRRDRATWIVERGFRDLFAALRKAERLDDALIVVAGDHGEFDNTGQHWMPRKRIETFDNGILSPLFFIKAPAALDAEGKAALRRNGQRLVANLDIAPTMAETLGVQLPAGRSYAGYSLFADVPADRVAYSTSTNEWRAWPRTSLAVSRGKERLVCDVSDLCHVSEADGPSLRFKRRAGPGDPLFDLAAADPVLRRTLGQIYREHF